MSSAESAPEEGGAAGEGLFRRWARRKQAAKAQPAPAPPVAAPAADVLPTPDAAVAEAPPALPDLDTLDAGSDYRLFLQQGVPVELQRLALQRAWSSDAAIAEIRGMAEYAWDFNAPRYGQLWAADNVAKLIQAVMVPPASDPLPEPAPTAAASLPDGPGAMVEAAPVPEAVEEASDEGPALDSVAARPRRHGSALPR